MLVTRLLRTFSVFAPAKPLRIVPALQTIEAYYQAIEDMEAHQYSDAAGHLQRVLKAIDTRHSGDQTSYAVAATLLAKAQTQQSLHTQAETTLAVAVERLSQGVEGHQEIYAQACLNLLIQRVHVNPTEAVAFGKKMLIPNLWKTLPLHVRADWHFLIGVKLI